jgi:hypothetical protein
METLPNRRHSLEGETYEGARLRMVYTIARKLYRCPGCHLSVEIGDGHTLVHYLSADPAYYQHWHRTCAAELIRQLKTRRVVPANQQRFRR